MILELYILKAIADKVNLTQNMKFVLEIKENIVGLGENTCYQFFQMFSFLIGSKTPGCVLKR